MQHMCTAGRLKSHRPVTALIIKQLVTQPVADPEFAKGGGADPSEHRARE